jgi:diguanylate cyclase (GGDEF)-like protein
MQKSPGNQEYAGLLTVGGKFLCAETESKFMESELASMRRPLSILIPILGCAFACFSLPDLLVLGRGANFAVAAIARAIFFLACAIAAFRLRSTTRMAETRRLVTLVSVCGSIAFSVILFLYRNENYYLQAMSVLIMIPALFLMPNSLALSCGLSVLIAASGLICLPFLESRIQLREMSAIVVYYVLALGIGLVAAWRTAHARRLEFSRTEELERISGTDPLTGLANRRAFEKYLDALLEGEGFGAGNSALGVLDLDNLKPVNDRYGHEAGDRVLRETAASLKSVVGDSGLAARWGGDEMVFCIRNARMEEAQAIAQRIRRAFESKAFGQGISVTASIGLTALCGGDDSRTAFSRADLALYRAKQSGRNRVEIAEAG